MSDVQSYLLCLKILVLSSLGKFFTFPVLLHLAMILSWLCSSYSVSKIIRKRNDKAREHSGEGCTPRDTSSPACPEHMQSKTKQNNKKRSVSTHLLSSTMVWAQEDGVHRALLQAHRTWAPTQPGLGEVGFSFLKKYCKQKIPMFERSEEKI